MSCFVYRSECCGIRSQSFAVVLKAERLRSHLVNCVQADGRRMKRAMEKENKKQRDVKRKEYNLIVRVRVVSEPAAQPSILSLMLCQELASYVKKRDRRVQQFLVCEDGRFEIGFYSREWHIGPWMDV